MDLGTLAYFHEVAHPAWLVSAGNGEGGKEWYVRFEMAGLLPRRIGPFGSPKDAARYYNETVRGFLNELAGGHDCRCVVEDALGQVYLKRGRQS